MTRKGGSVCGFMNYPEKFLFTNTYTRSSQQHQEVPSQGEGRRRKATNPAVSSSSSYYGGYGHAKCCAQNQLEVSDLRARAQMSNELTISQPA